MKKKILFGLGALAIAAVLAVNLNMVRNDQNVTLSLEQLGAVAQAQAEGGADTCSTLQCKKQRCNHHDNYWQCRTNGDLESCDTFSSCM
ncbi:MAG: hypothetical protein EHM93_15825 [Bacteroidales bacterium]|nr:MAG: hypothetical protein EHM93_15825 [Bacteroidales bacterium]